MASTETIAKVLALWRENWPNRAISENTIELYKLVFGDLPDVIVGQIALKCLEKCTYWPTIAEVKKYIPGEYRFALEWARDRLGQPEQTADEVYGQWAIERDKMGLFPKSRLRDRPALPRGTNGPQRISTLLGAIQPDKEEQK